ncbi:hypothetical protein VL06_11120 [Rossellomorea marisflavi]|nr:hypothetical protein VL06_11120 [Rossellomorea marisflavi]
MKVHLYIKPFANKGKGSQIEKWPVIRFAIKKSIFTNKIKNVASRWLNFAGITPPSQEMKKSRK